VKSSTIYNFICIVFILSVSVLTAQKWQGGARGGRPAVCEVSGIVVDSISGKPIEYASVSVLQKDGNIETGGVTGSDGKFQIGEIAPGQYSIKIEFMGYESQTLSEIELSFRGTIKKDVGEIKLSLVLLEMEAVNVVDDRPVFEFETDKMIYNTSDDIISDSGTAEDVLNKVPMVTVDQDGEVALRGNSNVKILVNGRPNRTGAGSNDVDNIPASLIDKVEVITSPSAKYDPDGMAGIINIVMKKGKYEGLNGSIKVNGKNNNYGGMGDMNGFTAYGNYKTEKWNFYTSYNLNNRVRNTFGHRDVEVRYFDIEGTPQDTVPLYSFLFNNESDRFGQSIKLGSDYSINENLILTGEVNYKVHLRQGTKNQDNLRDADILTLEKDGDDNYGVEGYFEIEKTFDNPDREFNFSTNYDFAINDEMEILSSISDSTLLNENMSGLDIDVSYKHPLNQDTKIEFGYDGRLNNNNETMDFQLTDSNNNTFLGVNTFRYKRDIHSFFIEYNQKLSESFSIKPSVRYEYIRKNIKSKSDIMERADTESIPLYIQVLDTLQNSAYIDDYTTLYPDLHFTFNINEKQSIQFGLSKRANRPGSGGHGPGSRQIRPYPRGVYSQNFLFLGNPFLKPEYSTQYEVSFKSTIPMGFAYTNLYYHQLENVIEWYDDNHYENSNVLTFKNADSGENMGVEFFFMIMGQTLGGGYNYSKLDDPTGDYELNGNHQRLTLYNRISLPEKYIKYFSFEFGFFFMKMKVPGGSLFGDKGTMWANMGISKSLFDGKMEISLGLNNLFDRGGFQMKREKPLDSSLYNGYAAASEFSDVATDRGGRTLKLNLIYRFGQLQEEKRKSRHMGRGDQEGMDMGY